MSSQIIVYGPGSAVQAANGMTAGLKGTGDYDDLVLLSQGAEETVAGGELGSYRSVQVHFGSGYQKQAGGSPDDRATAAEFVNVFNGYGIATASNTFWGFQNGREALYRGFNFAADPYIRRGLVALAMTVGNLSWPMVADDANDAHIEHAHTYQLTKGGMAQNLAATIQQHGLDKHPVEGHPLLAAHYTNLPNNPLGLHGTTDEVSGTQALLDHLNEFRAAVGLPLVMHIVDNPYFMGLPQKNDGGSILASPYEGVFERNGKTPVVIITSLAKALGYATPGVHIITFSDDEMAAKYEKWIKSKSGFSYFPEAMDAVVKSVHRRQFPALKALFGKMGDKYRANFEIVQQGLGELLLPGDPGMVCTFEAPDDVQGKVMEIHGKRFEIRTNRDLLTHAANVNRVVAVDQSTDGKWLTRLALKAEKQDDVKRGVDGLRRTIDEACAAPSI